MKSVYLFTNQTKCNNKTMIKLGLIADVQYCDCEDGMDYSKTRKRYYRNSLEILDHSLNFFKSEECFNILQLGDLIDGKCKELGITNEALNAIGKRFEEDKFEVFHVIGNHELYNLSRRKYCDSFMGNSLKKYRNCETELNYYKVDLTPKVCLIILDTYEISVLGERTSVEGENNYLTAKKIILEHNKNENWNDSYGLQMPRFVAYNGAVGQTQLKWLEEQLKECTIKDKIVIVAGHIPLLIQESDKSTMMWNSEELIDILHRYTCVKAYLCGHNHVGHILKSDTFIHITMPAILESPLSDVPYGILQITENQVSLSDMPGYWKATDYFF